MILYLRTFEFFLSQINATKHLGFLWNEEFKDTMLSEVTTQHHVAISYRNFAASYWIQKFDHLGYKLNPTLTRQLRLIASLEVNSAENFFAENGLVFERRVKDVFKHNDAILTWAAGQEFCKRASVKVFVESLNRTTYNGHKFVFTHDMDMESREYFEQSGFRIFDVDPAQCEWILRDRYKVYHEFLKHHKFKKIFLLDAKDVLFQTNPSEAFGNQDLYFVSEGKTHSECDWNTKDQQNLQLSITSHTKSYLDDFQNWEVLCGGTIMGCSKAIQELIMLIWLGTLFTGKSTDQAVLNYVYRHYYQDKLIVDPRIHSLVATADLPRAPEPVIGSDVVVRHRETSEPYCLWHQWDRTKYHDSIIRKYT